MDHNTAVDLIWNAWHNAGDYPQDLSDWLDYDRALDVQTALLKRRVDAGETLLGWKIGLTSERVRTLMGTSDQPYGHIMRVLETNDRASVSDIGNRSSIEAELVVTMGATLKGPDVTIAMAREATATIAAGFEINQNRIPKHEDFALLVADNLTQWAIVTGPAIPVPNDYASENMQVEMICNGETLTDVIGGPDIIDDHFYSVATLANVLSTRGLALEAGQKLITGSFARHPIGPNQAWTARFAGIGEVNFTIDG